MNDDQIETLLRRYRPVTRLPGSPFTRSVRTWPWAAAAAALLAVTIGLHAASWRPSPQPAIDPAQVAAIAEQLGGGEEGRLVAEWVVAQQRAPARLDPAPPPFVMSVEPR